MVEHAAVNRAVAGSSPAPGANFVATVDQLLVDVPHKNINIEK
jgi:hypothetical protein